MTGRLTTKGNKYYMILNLKDELGEYKQKWIRTGLNIQGNKELAQSMLEQKINEFNIDADAVGSSIEFTEFLLQWLKIKRLTIQETTYESYKGIVNSHVIPYFEKKLHTLHSINASALQTYYLEKTSAGLSANTLHKHHNVLNGVLTYAVEQGFRQSNPMDKVVVPRKKPAKTEFFTTDEILTILNKVRGTPIEPAVYLAVYTGFRRGEVLGTRWKRSIDWQNGTIMMNHTVLQCGSDIIFKDGGKSGSSNRSIVMPAPLQKYLQRLYREQKLMRAAHPQGYTDSDYICRHPDGRMLTPAYVSRYFKKFLKKHGLPEYRFHVLRHTAATFLLAQGHTLLEIMLLLGHKRQESSARYTHLQSNALAQMANSFNSLAVE